MTILDTYDLGNGYRAELRTCVNYSLKTEYYLNIVKGETTVYLGMTYEKNPFDAIFILMDLGLVKAEYTLMEAIMNHPLHPKQQQINPYVAKSYYQP